MSTTDNWDDSSDDEEGENPPDPTNDEDAYPYEGKDKRYEYEAQFIDAKEDEEGGVGGYPPNEEFVDAKASEEGYPTEEYTPEDESGGEGGDPSEDEDYEDELDDYDKKLGRYVSCR